ncbi:hypothetical protein [Quatrionicoccus australiensis]|uniref:hypothetical protein n=1 Tax=Quatrionicoccus australiensis TaxID=138118 RepID=UPI001CF8A85D|nr:hypothetical protein [Quatrionicoccus australiensis]UCV16455.1 hypothetical protein KI612_07090 [Quatrionicoccus australiensis]
MTAAPPRPTLSPEYLDNARILTQLPPGAPGTGPLVDRYGDALVCIRQRLDPQQKRKLTTVEIIVETQPAEPEPTAWLRIGYGETELRERVKKAGGKWHPEHKLWQLPLKTVKALGLEMRVVADA